LSLVDTRRGETKKVSLKEENLTGFVRKIQGEGGGKNLEIEKSALGRLYTQGEKRGGGQTKWERHEC